MRAHLAQWLMAVAMLLLSVGASPCAAEPLWQKLVFMKRVEADPQKSYHLTDAQGPWLILATTFTGEQAEEDAQKLALELRREFNLPAYTYRVKFDFRGQEEGRGIDRYGEPIRRKYRQDVIDEVAVMVGDFQSVEDSNAQRTLERIKFLEPDCLSKQSGENMSRPMAEFRDLLRNARQGTVMKNFTIKNVKRNMGPMAGAHLTTNPLLPNEYYVPKGIDSFVLEMNRGVDHCLLDCPGRYTVRVATFTGRLIIDQKEIHDVETEKKPLKSQLAEAADKAHRLTEALREQGYTAFEFHDRYQSIVTVGSFDSYGSPRADGKIEINPAIHTLMTTFGAEKKVVPGQAAPQVGMPRTVAGVNLDIQPMIVEVPRRSVSSDYAGPGLFSRR